MVVDDVAADEMGNPVLAAPVPFPVIAVRFRPFLREGDVADRGIDPDIDHEIIAARELHTPFECPGDAPVMEFILDPADRIVLRIARAPQGIEIREEEVLELREFEEVMFLVAELRLCAADLADRVLDLAGLKVLAASLVALVAPGRFPAVGAGALHVPVREEAFALRAVCLVDDLLVNVPVLLEFGNDGLRAVVVCRVVGHAETVEHDVHSFECLIEVCMVAFRERPWGDAGFFSRNYDGCPVIVRTADEDHFFAHPPHVADVRISRDVRSQVSEMAGAVCVRQPAGDEQRWRMS